MIQKYHSKSIVKYFKHRKLSLKMEIAKCLWNEESFLRFSTVLQDLWFPSIKNDVTFTFIQHFVFCREAGDGYFYQSYEEPTEVAIQIRVVLKKRGSENMQQFTGEQQVSKQLYWNHPSVWVFSCKFAAYFQNTFF